ncbi:unnamed protein product [Hymenolepis diminuta]|uniref:Uncharacterized protein n=1 Tax=Hymenolepis diminuta TaxID=6216 RepID=A0A0R3STR4_HYMDI|nr:unnamed protein product [Hymenolepis diminuta]VUZ39206.1 unnamed protein product [Hymenolepis diminuta]
MSEERIQLKKSVDNLAKIPQPEAIEKSDASLPSVTKSEPIVKEEEIDEEGQTSSSSGPPTHINPPDVIIISSNLSSKEFEQNYQNSTEKSKVISIPKVIEISITPSPNKTELTSEANDTRDSIRIQDQAQSETGSQSSASANLLDDIDVGSNSAKEFLYENARRKLMAENLQMTSLPKSIDLSPSSSPIGEMKENKGTRDPTGVQYQVQNGTNFQSSAPVNPPDSSDISKLESRAVEIVQLISLPKLVEITLPPSPKKKERTAGNMDANEPIKAKDQTQFELDSQSSTPVNLSENFTKTERIEESKVTSLPRKDQIELDFFSSTPPNLSGFNTTEFSGEFNEKMKLEQGAVKKSQPPSNSRPGILKCPTAKESETETPMTKSEFAELLGKLISAIKIEEGVEITVEELSDEIFHYFGGNKEIMAIRLSGDYAQGIISKLTEQETSEKKNIKKSVTFALENEEVEIEPRSRSRSNSLVDKSAEKLKKVRSFIETIFRI